MTTRDRADIAALMLSSVELSRDDIAVELGTLATRQMLLADPWILSAAVADNDPRHVLSVLLPRVPQQPQK